MLWYEKKSALCNTLYVYIIHSHISYNSDKKYKHTYTNTYLYVSHNKYQIPTYELRQIKFIAFSIYVCICVCVSLQYSNSLKRKHPSKLCENRYGTRKERIQQKY